MISSALAMLLAVAAAENPVQVRGDYSRCIKQFIRSSVEKKLEPASFDTAFAAACQDKEVRLKALLIKTGLSMGMKPKESEKATAEELSDYRVMAKEDFQAELASAPKP
jgi:hypothetical protein